MTYEFIYDFMYMKNIVKSFLNSGVSRFQMSELTSGQALHRQSQLPFCRLCRPPRLCSSPPNPHPAGMWRPRARRA